MSIQSSTTKPSGESLLINPMPIYWSMGIWTVLLGVALVLAPNSWFGPSWHYFSEIPHNGIGMGLCLLTLSSVQMLGLWRKASPVWLSVTFFLTGFVYWASGILLGAEGLLGHQGLIEAPFMMYVGTHNFTHSSSLMAYARQMKRAEKK